MDGGLGRQDVIRRGARGNRMKHRVPPHLNALGNKDVLCAAIGGKTGKLAKRPVRLAHIVEDLAFDDDFRTLGNIEVCSRRTPSAASASIPRCFGLRLNALQARRRAARPDRWHPPSRRASGSYRAYKALHNRPHRKLLLLQPERPEPAAAAAAMEPRLGRFFGDAQQDTG